MLSPNCLVSAITAAAIAIAKDKSNDELEILAAVFTQLGDTIATIVTQREICENCCDTVKNKE